TRLMEAFHRHLLISKSGAITKAEALRQASIEMMRDPQYRSQPFYWAGFVLIGDGL
nr:CHAT domain-containing protein [Pyrinomonadaceae bacterium]